MEDRKCSLYISITRLPHQYNFRALRVLLYHFYHMLALAPMHPAKHHAYIEANMDSYKDAESYISFETHREAPMAYIYSIFTAKSTWRQAENYCKSIGGSLFTLDSYEQWIILFENIVYLRQELELSTLLFLGMPNTRKVHYFTDFNLVSKYCW